MKSKLNNNGMVGGVSGVAGSSVTSGGLGGSQGGGLSKEFPNIQTRSLGSGLPPANGGQQNPGGGQSSGGQQSQQQTQSQNGTGANYAGLSAYLQNGKSNKITTSGGGGAMQIRHSSLRNQLKEIYMSNGTPAGGATINQQSTNMAVSGNNTGANGPNIRDMSQDPPTTGHKKTNSLGPLASINGSGIKYVKPQELNLDMIVPSSLKGVKPSSSTMGGQGHQNVPTGLGTGGPTNVSSILQNLRTPQGNPNSILSPIQHPPINKNKDAALAALAQNHPLSPSQNVLGGGNGVIKRNNNQRVMIGSINNTHGIQKPLGSGPGSDLLLQTSSVGSPQGRIGTGKEKGQQQINIQQHTQMLQQQQQNSSILSTPLKNKSVPINLSINQSAALQNSGITGGGSVVVNARRDNNLIGVKKSSSVSRPQDERLNLSIDVANQKGTLEQASMKLSRINEERMNHSLDGANSSREEKNASKNDDGQQSNAAQVLDIAALKSQNFQLNFENLIHIEDKLSVLIENLRQSKLTTVSQLCSDWWELTDEDEYQVAKFEKVYKDDKAKREIKVMMVLEILSVSVTNYFTSTPELIRPTHLQLNQVRNLLSYVHQNFLNVAELILSKLPENFQNNYATQLSNVLKQKRAKKSKKNEGFTVTIRANNENIVNLLKNLVRSSSQNSSIPMQNPGMPFGGLQGKKIGGKQALMKGMAGGYLNGPPLKPLYAAINKAMKHLESQSVVQTRNSIIKASEEIEVMKQYAQLPPLYGVGGTSIGGYEPLPLVDAPYLPPVKDPNTYTLVLDLDETLVHYFEIGSEGHFLVRPGCDVFLKEMSQIYEVVIFTAAMQDYADWVLDQIDKDKCISHRMYRQHALPYGPIFVKDLSRIGRDLSRTIIVDNVAENFQLQPDNGIFIKSWFDDMSDTALSELAPLLKEITKKQVNDVRDALRKFRDQMLEQISKGIQNPQLSLD